MLPPDVLIIKSGGYHRETWNIGGYPAWMGEEDAEVPENVDEYVLARGVHELKFRARYSISPGTENQEVIEIWSNTVKLTVK